MKKYKNRIVAGVVLGLLILISSVPAMAEEPSITLYPRSPIPAGSLERIAWYYTASFEPNVTLELFKDGTFNRTIISDTNIGSSGQGIYDWAIPLSLETGMYQVKITGNTTSGSEVTNTTDLEITTATADDCRGCHYDPPVIHHSLLTSSPKRTALSCGDCHPMVNGTLSIDRNCLNCHNGTAFWGSPLVNPGEPHLGETPPVINNVTLSTNTPNTGDLILVTVNATDDDVIYSVTANGGPLTQQGNDIWTGSITAIEGTHPVNVSAGDTSGRRTWDDSASYTAVTPSITVTSPMTGDNWNRDTTQTIIWTYTGDLGSNAIVELLEQGDVDQTWTNVPQANGVGSLEWAIPSKFEVSTYQIRVSAGGYSNTTGNFNIVKR